MTAAEQQVDVVIVGAGLVGSALARALAKSDVRVLLLDQQAEIPHYSGYSFDPRVVALSPAATRFLDHLGVWQEIHQERACPYLGMEVWDGEGNGRIRFSNDDLHRDYLGHIVENSVVLRALRRDLENQLELRVPLAVTAWSQVGDLNHLELSDGTSLVAPLLIGADGAHSQLRGMAHIPVREWDYHHQAIVTTIRTQRSHGFVARQRFSHQGPLALLPLQRDERDPGDYCSIVWSLESPVADEMQALDDAAFCQSLTRTSESCLGEVVWADQRFCLPLWQRHARDYGRAGFALVGDAAHSIHPLAGQGVNLGLYDARALAEEVMRAKARRVPLQHASVVQRYQRRRQGHNLMAMAGMEGFKQLFGSALPPLLSLRNRGMAWVDGQSWLKRWLMQAAAGEF
jgi:2-octaprenylphenol hydroxylase